MKPFVIGICDDEMAAVLQIEKIVTDYLEREKKEAQVFLFQNGKELLEHVEELNVLFLDIEMPELDGIEVGKIICKRNKECKIIMATSRLERFKEAFKIDAFRFVTKPFNDKEIEEALQDAFDIMIGMGCIDFYEDRMLHKIQQKDIRYIKAYGGFIEAKVGNRKLRREISLLKLEEVLEENIFFRINREILVNMFEIRNSSKTVFTKNKKLPETQKKIKKIMV